MPTFELKSEKKDHDMFKDQYSAFRSDTDFIGIFKKNLHEPKSPQVISGEEILGVTAGGKGQLVRIVRTKYRFWIEW